MGEFVFLVNMSMLCCCSYFLIPLNMTNTQNLALSYRRYALYELEHTPKTLKQTQDILAKLTEFAGTTNIHALDTRIIREFLHVGREERAWSAKTFRIYRQCLKTYFNWLVEEEWLDSNPVDKIKQPPLPQRLPRCLGREQVLQLFCHVRDYPWHYELQPYRNEAMLATLTYTGLRLSELRNLGDRDVDFLSDLIRVDQGKNRKDRYVPICPELKPILVRYKKAHKRLGLPSIWFFPSVKSERRMTAQNIQSVFRKLSKASGIKVTPQMLRHTFGRLLVESNVHMRTSQKYMGHASIRTTEIYTHVSPEHGQKEIRKLKVLSPR